MIEKDKAALARFRNIVSKHRDMLDNTELPEQLHWLARFALEAEAAPLRAGAEGQAPLCRMICRAEEERGEVVTPIAAHTMSAIFAGRRPPQIAFLQRVAQAASGTIRLTF